MVNRCSPLEVEIVSTGKVVVRDVTCDCGAPSSGWPILPSSPVSVSLLVRNCLNPIFDQL